MMKRFRILILFALSRFFINTYGICLKFFLQLNGGYWSRIGVTGNINEKRIKKEIFISCFSIFFWLYYLDYYHLPIGIL